MRVTELTGSWDTRGAPPARGRAAGYVADRQRVLDFIKVRKPANPIVITGDAHVHSVRNVPPDFEHFDAPPVATEFIGTSITSADSQAPAVVEILSPEPNNPHRLFQSNQRGYVRVEVTPGAWRTEHRVVSTVLEPGGVTSTRARFVVEDGNPAAIPDGPLD